MSYRLSQEESDANEHDEDNQRDISVPNRKEVFDRTGASRESSFSVSALQEQVLPQIELSDSHYSTTQAALASEQTRHRFESFAAAAQTYATLRTQQIESQARALGTYANLASQSTLQWLFNTLPSQMSAALMESQLATLQGAISNRHEVTNNTSQYEILLAAQANQNQGNALRFFLQQLPSFSQLTASVPSAGLHDFVQNELSLPSYRLPGIADQIQDLMNSSTITSSPLLGTVNNALSFGSRQRLSSPSIQENISVARVLEPCEDLNKNIYEGKGKQDFSNLLPGSDFTNEKFSSIESTRRDTVKRENESNDSVCSLRKKRRRRYRHESFPRKLYRLLEETAIAGRSHLISFTDSGQSFRVHDPEAFANEIVPIYFRHNQYPSFQRQLSMYGFERIQRGPDYGAYWHPMFQRNQPQLCDKVIRVTEQETVTKSTYITTRAAHDTGK